MGLFAPWGLCGGVLISHREGAKTPQREAPAHTVEAKARLIRMGLFICVRLFLCVSLCLCGEVLLVAAMLRQVIRNCSYRASQNTVTSQEGRGTARRAPTLPGIVTILREAQ